MTLYNRASAAHETHWGGRLDLVHCTDQYNSVIQNHDQEPRYSEEVWCRFLGARSRLYLPNRTPNGDYDPKRVRDRRLWTHKELQVFGNVVEQRTQALLLRQEATLEYWAKAATNIQRLIRGFLGRKRVAKFLADRYESAMELKRLNAQAQRDRKRSRAACCIQYTVRFYLLHRRILNANCARIQRLVRLFLFRTKRQRAAISIQHAYRQYRRRCKISKAFGTVVRLLRMSRQKESLEQHARTFRLAQEATRKEREKQLLTSMDLRVGQRKSQLKSSCQIIPVKKISRKRIIYLPRLNQIPSIPETRRNQRILCKMPTIF